VNPFIEEKGETRRTLSVRRTHSERRREERLR